MKTILSKAAIQSVGLPPERHADRMVAMMLQHLAARHARISTEITHLIEHSKDGHPKAQAKLAARLKRAGAIAVKLTPGKRGKYLLTFLELLGWDPARDATIAPDAALPAKPWLACYLNVIDSPGGGRNCATCKSYLALCITHHVLSRFAQRFGLQTTEDMLDVIEIFVLALFKLFEAKTMKEALDATPAAGHRIEVKVSDTLTMTVVLQRHARLPTLVAATIF